MSRRFRWTRARWYKAKHLSRLLVNLPVNAPPLVDRYHELLTDRYDNVGRRDPLLEPVRWRLDRYSNDIPF